MAPPATNPEISGRVRRDFELHRTRQLVHRHHHMSTLGIIVLIVAIAWALIVLLQPAPKYHLAAAPDGAVDSPEFARQLEAMTDTKLQRASAIEVLDNGRTFTKPSWLRFAGQSAISTLRATSFIAATWQDALSMRSPSALAPALRCAW